MEAVMYTREQFGEELKERLLEKQELYDIGHWAYTVYLMHIDNIDFDFRDILLELNTMEDGPEFYLSYEKLMRIADDLIAGRDVDLNSEDYREV